MIGFCKVLSRSAHWTFSLDLEKPWLLFRFNIPDKKDQANLKSFPTLKKYFEFETKVSKITNRREMENKSECSTSFALFWTSFIAEYKNKQMLDRHRFHLVKFWFYRRFSIALSETDTPSYMTFYWKIRLCQIFCGLNVSSVLRAPQSNFEFSQTVPNSLAKKGWNFQPPPFSLLQQLKSLV